MNLNRNRMTAYPSSQDFFGALNNELTQKHLNEIEERMRRDNMSVDELECEIRFMQRASQAKKTPFATHEEFVEFANKLQAYTSCLMTKRVALAWAGE